MSKKSSSKKFYATKSRGREIAVQMAYSSLITDTGYDETISSFMEEYADEPEESMMLASRLFKHAYDNKEKDEELISQFISKSWSLDRIGSVERCILRLGVSEFFLGETPFYAVIDEYVTLAKMYGDDKSAAFVNGVLENIKNKFSLELTHDKK